MNRTTATGLFIMLTMFIVLVSVFGGHFSRSIPNITELTVINEGVVAHKDAFGIVIDNISSWVPRIDPSGVNAANWLVDAVSFMWMMVSFQMPGAVAFSILWWFLSALWFWLLIVVITGKGN